MPNNRCVSISSRPLLTRDAEFSVFIGPIDQVGMGAGLGGVTVSRSAALQPRNGPPEAVSTKRATSSGPPERRHCASAECSESTGTIWPGCGGLEHQRAAGYQRLFVGQRQPGAAGQRGQGGFQTQRADQPLRTTSAVGVSSMMRVAASGPTKRISPSCAAAGSGSATAMLVDSGLRRAARPARRRYRRRRPNRRPRTGRGWRRSPRAPASRWTRCCPGSEPQPRRMAAYQERNGTSDHCAA